MTLTLSAVVLSCLAGCETYRVEYHRKPHYYRDAAVGGLPDRVQLSDGTTIVYDARDVRQRASGAKSATQTEPGKRLEIREEDEHGNITLRALIPEHVIANAIACLENEEYELMYTQLLSEHTRLEWEGLGHDLNDFAAHFASHRREMLRSLTRLYIGLSQLETVIENLDHGLIECRLSPRVARGHKFTRVRVIREGYGLKLLTIR